MIKQDKILGLLNDIMDYTDIEKLPGIFLFVDFEKAFDTVEWSFI